LSGPAGSAVPMDSVPSTEPVLDTLDIIDDAVPVDGAPEVTNILGGLSDVELGGASGNPDPLLPDFGAIPGDLDFAENQESLPTADLIKPDAPGIVIEPVGVTLDQVLQPMTPVANHVAPVAQLVPDTLVPEPVSPVLNTVVEPAPAVLRPLTPALESVASIAEPVFPVLSPLTALAEPVKTVVEPVAPVLEPMAPVADAIAPALEPVAPVLEPVRPVVGHIAEPILLHVHPALEPLAPVVDPVLEIAVPDLKPISAPVYPIAGPDPNVAPTVPVRGSTSPIVDAPPIAFPDGILPVADANATSALTDREASTGQLSFNSGLPAANAIDGITEPVAGQDTSTSVPSISFRDLIETRAHASTAANKGMLPLYHADSPAGAIAPLPPAPAPSPQGSSAPATVPTALAVDPIATESELWELLVRIPSSIHQSVPVPPG
jgi:hypothetical protein